MNTKKSRHRDDFSMRAQFGFWSEELVLKALNSSGVYHAIHYGASGIKTKSEFDEQVAAFDLVNAETKRPDILVFSAALRERVNALVAEITPKALPYTDESLPRMRELLRLTSFAIECEGSNGNAEDMILRKRAYPSIHIKEVDINLLLSWQATTGVPISVYQLFVDRGYRISLNDAVAMISTGAAKKKHFQPRKGEQVNATTPYYQIQYNKNNVHPLGDVIGATPVSRVHQQMNGQYKPYLTYEGGVLVVEGLIA